jgi:hypothetical protein
MNTPESLQEPPNFSLDLGGPVYRILSRSHSASPVQNLHRHAVICVLVCWVPLAVLSLVQGHFLGDTNLPFLRDIETHVRFLVALPALILAELNVRRRIQPMLKRFVERHLINPEELPKFYAAVSAAVRLHNSVVVEIVLLVLVFTVGAWLWRHQLPLDVLSWYASSQGGQIHLTMSGYWLAFVSVPIFQFILVRWYIHILIWIWFLLRISYLNLYLQALHPDRAAGLGFVGKFSVVFEPLLFAQNALLSAQIVSRILYHGESLLASEMTIFGYVLLSVAVALVPLLSFAPQLMRAKRDGLARYGNFASEFVTDFDRKWLQGKVNDEEILSNNDIQSLSDLDNSFAMVSKMRPVPFSHDDVILLLVAAIVPFLPLLLTIIPLDQLIVRVIKLVI